MCLLISLLLGSGGALAAKTQQPKPQQPATSVEPPPGWTPLPAGNLPGNAGLPINEDLPVLPGEPPPTAPFNSGGAIWGSLDTMTPGAGGELYIPGGPTDGPVFIQVPEQSQQNPDDAKSDAAKPSEPGISTTPPTAPANPDPDGQQVQKEAEPASAQPESLSQKESEETKKARFDLIIDKNLFSPDRKKWISEPPAKPGAQMAKKELDDLILLGTIISSGGNYAVLRSKRAKAPQASNSLQPYAKGDYVQGYFVKEIEEKKVTLLDEAENLMYVLFINDDKKVRVAEKTERKPETPSKPAASEPAKPTGAPAKAAAPKRPRFGSQQSPAESSSGARQPAEVRQSGPTGDRRMDQENRRRLPAPMELPENMRQSLDQVEEDQEEE